ncbi:MAG: hypothetical protein LBR98_08820, partial [Syntrophomonadaceae bacterium]|nr:hypothetical protein [Syntrophomonadaceae bacterium]
MKPKKCTRICSILLTAVMLLTMLPVLPPPVAVAANPVNPDNLFGRLGFNFPNPTNNEERADENPYGSRVTQFVNVNELLYSGIFNSPAYKQYAVVGSG